jgi:Tfp pilus assembly protein PilV
MHLLQATLRRSRKTSLRNESGLYLIELLVALIFGAIITFALLSILSQSMRQSTTSENQLVASSIAQELLENTRNESYQFLSTIPAGQYTLLSNEDTSGQIGPAAVRTDPVGLDFVNLAWTNVKTKGNEFKGTVLYQIQPGSVANSLVITITVQWSDSQSVNRTITTSTVVFQQGTNYWQ